MFNQVKGTHDIILNDAEKYTFVEQILVAVAQTFGYKEFRTPIMEYTELFNRSVGDSSDIVRKEMYTFEDKGGRSITLRPELTAGVIRSMVNNKLFVNQDYPVKGYYVGPCFRYERPQAGRYRQFNQFGIECVGSDSPLRDAEVILLGYQCLVNLNFYGVTLKINTLGDEESRNAYRKALKEYFAKHIDIMCNDCKARYELNVLRILDCKSPEDQEIVKGAPKIKDYLTPKAKEDFEKVLKVLDDNQIPYTVDESLVRGLDYYSNVVFEFHYSTPSGTDYGALGGGGHYHSLVKECGGPEIPGVGLAFGIERLVTILDEYNAFEEFKPALDAYIMPIGEAQIEYGIQLANSLRDEGFMIEICLENKGMSQMFKKAQRRNAKYAIIIGEDEVKNGTVNLKDLEIAEQITISIDELSDKLNEQYHEEHHCCCHDHDEEEHHCCHEQDGEEEHECCYKKEK